MSFSRPTRLTRAQKIELTHLGYDPKKYLLNMDSEILFNLKEKKTGNNVVVYRREENNNG